MSLLKSRLEWLWIATASHWADGDRPTVAA
jgi:hypothetical protein